MIYTGLVYLAFAFSFLILGIILLRRLNLYFPGFYEQNKKMLIIAFSGLFFSMALRGAIDTARFIDEDFEKHVNVNEALYNLLLTIAGDLIPIIFQLSTMIFGYIRNKNEKKNRLEVKD